MAVILNIGVPTFDAHSEAAGSPRGYTVILGRTVIGKQ